MVYSSYNYVRISDPSTPYNSFSTFPNIVPNLFVNASINDTGYVDYEGLAGTTANYLPPSAVYTGNGINPPTTLVSTSNYQFTDNSGNTYNSGIFFTVSSNTSGSSVLSGSGYNLGTSQVNASGPTAIINVTDGSINNVAYSATPFTIAALNKNESINDLTNQIGEGSFVAEPSINNQGIVAYIAGNSDGTKAIITQSLSGGTPTTIAQTGSNSEFSDFRLGGLDVGRGEGPFAKYTIPSINDKGKIAFNADLNGGGKGIFVSNGTNITPVIDETTNGPFSYFSLPSLNSNGTVAFNVGFNTGGAAIVESTNGKLTTITDTSSSIFKDFTSDVALNQLGDIAFQADLNDGSTAIYTSTSSGLQKVIGVGDTLDGSTVATLFLSREGLNDAGQIAFDAVLTNGVQEVFRADPVTVPEPTNVPGLGIAMLVIICYHLRPWKKHLK